jgi:hypothetical protein
MLRTHQSSWVGEVSADLAVNLDLALLEDPLGLGVREGVLETVADEDDEWEALAELVWSGRWAWGLSLCNG